MESRLISAFREKYNCWRIENGSKNVSSFDSDDDITSKITGEAVNAEVLTAVFGSNQRNALKPPKEVVLGNRRTDLAVWRGS